MVLTLSAVSGVVSHLRAARGGKRGSDVLSLAGGHRVEPRVAHHLATRARDQNRESRGPDAHPELASAHAEHLVACVPMEEGSLYSTLLYSTTTLPYRTIPYHTIPLYYSIHEHLGGVSRKDHTILLYYNMHEHLGEVSRKDHTTILQHARAPW